MFIYISTFIRISSILYKLFEKISLLLFRFKTVETMVDFETILRHGLLLDDEKKQALRNYKYAGEDQSFLAPFMYKLWRIFFVLVPKRISPNLVTLFGLSMILLAFTVIHITTNDDDTFNCLIFAIALFIYQTADALDGMQGKRVRMYENATTEVSFYSQQHEKQNY